MPIYEVVFHTLGDTNQHARLIRAPKESAAKGALKAHFGPMLRSPKNDLQGDVLIIDGIREVYWHEITNSQGEILE